MEKICLWDGAVALQKYFKTQNDTDASQVKILEKEADNIRKNIIEELKKTFITPFERGYLLSFKNY